MMTNVDYARLYFKYPVPTPINGEYINITIKHLKHELRANTSSVDTDLGGGNHEYLGLYLSDVEYALIIPIPTPFVVSVWPSTLEIEPDTIAVEAIHAKEAHHDECSSTDSVKISKRHCCISQKTLELKYIKPLLNEDTGLIEDDLPTVIQ